MSLEPNAEIAKSLTAGGARSIEGSPTATHGRAVRAGDPGHQLAYPDRHRGGQQPGDQAPAGEPFVLRNEPHWLFVAEPAPDCLSASKA